VNTSDCTPHHGKKAKGKEDEVKGEEVKEAQSFQTTPITVTKRDPLGVSFCVIMTPLCLF